MLHVIIVHGRVEIYKIIDGEPYFLSKNKKGPYWQITVVEPKRLYNYPQIFNFSDPEEMAYAEAKVGFW
jgi:hypothetical protein